MKKRIVGVAIAAAALSMTAGPAFAGTLNPKACAGQSTAYVAQAGDISFVGLTSAKGIGNVAKTNGLTTQDIVDGIRYFCAFAP